MVHVVNWSDSSKFLENFGIGQYIDLFQSKNEVTLYDG